TAEAKTLRSCLPNTAATMQYVTQAKADVPAANPSRPSVRFTALDTPIITKLTNNEYPAIPRSGLKEVKGITTPVPRVGSVATYIPRRPDSNTWKASLYRALSPSGRFNATMMKSSARPIAANPRVTKRAHATSRVLGAKRSVDNEAPSRIIMPPIVGVPAFLRWVEGPSCLIDCPIFKEVNTSIAFGPITRTIAKASRAEYISFSIG